MNYENKNNGKISDTINDISMKSGVNKCNDIGKDWDYMPNNKTINMMYKVCGDLIVIGYSGVSIEKSGNYRAMWKCKCKCGNETIVSGKSLRNGNTKTCGCNNGGIEYHKKRPFEWLYNILLYTANKSGRICNITYDEFLKFTEINNCHYCNRIIKWNSYSKYGCSVGYHLDRKNNKIGYIAENCVVCCDKCNVGKCDKFSYDEWYIMTECFRNGKLSNVL